MMISRENLRNLEESPIDFPMPEMDSLPLSNWAGKLNIFSHI